MNIKFLFAMILGVGILIGNTVQGEAACLIDCEEALSPQPGQEESGEAGEQEGEGEEERDQRDLNGSTINQNRATGQGNQAFGNVTDSVILNGVEMNVDNKVTVGTNTGQINATATAVIMGVDKSHNNSSRGN